MIEIKKEIKEKPTLSFYCMKCNLFFKVDGETLLEDIKCPKCETYEIFIEIEFDEKIPNYFS